LSQDIGKLLSSIHGVGLSGSLHFGESLQVAQLVLKHRQNKNQRQRIVCFVGSPLEENEQDLVKLGKKLKKNNVAVDVVNFGEEIENTAKLEAFIAAVNSSENRWVLLWSFPSFFLGIFLKFFPLFFLFSFFSFSFPFFFFFLFLLFLLFLFSCSAISSRSLLAPTF